MDNVTRPGARVFPGDGTCDAPGPRAGPGGFILDPTRPPGRARAHAAQCTRPGRVHPASARFSPTKVLTNDIGGRERQRTFGPVLHLGPFQ